MTSKFFLLLIICLSGMSWARDIPLPMVGEEKILQILRDNMNSKIITPEEMQECLDRSVKEQKVINEKYIEDTELCQENISEERKALEDESNKAREAITGQGSASCSALADCSSKDNDIASFYTCYNREGSAASESIKQLALQSKNAASNHESKSNLIDIKLSICANSAKNTYDNSVAQSSLKFQMCLTNGVWPEDLKVQT